MRRASDNYKFIENGSIFIGISLGYDYCAEHEWGIKGMHRVFGIDTNKMGVDGRTITKNDTIFFIDKDKAILRTDYPYEKNRYTDFKSSLPYGLYYDKNKPLQTAWDDDSFGIIVTGKDGIEKLKQLKEAFEKNDIVIGHIKSELPAFENTSLCILIRSRLPQTITDGMYNVDKKAIDLINYEKSIGMTDLKNNKRGEYSKGKKYFMACSPKWIDYEDEKAREERKNELETKYDIRYWVNYSDDDNNWGWYNVETIKKWLETPNLNLKSLNK